MSWRQAWMYVVAWLALTAYYQFAVRHPDTGAVRPQGQVVGPGAHAADATTLEITSPRGRVVFKRAGDRWVVAEPAGGTVASDLVAAVLGTLSGSAPGNVVGREESRLAEFGLDVPAMRLTLYGTGGPPQTLALGSRNPAGVAVYGRWEGEPEILLLGLNVEYYAGLVLDAVAGAGTAAMPPGAEE